MSSNHGLVKFPAQDLGKDLMTFFPFQLFLCDLKNALGLTSPSWFAFQIHCQTVMEIKPLLQLTSSCSCSEMAISNSNKATTKAKKRILSPSIRGYRSIGEEENPDDLKEKERGETQRKQMPKNSLLLLLPSPSKQSFSYSKRRRRSKRKSQVKREWEREMWPWSWWCSRLSQL